MAFPEVGLGCVLVEMIFLGNKIPGAALVGGGKGRKETSAA